MNEKPLKKRLDTLLQNQFPSLSRSYIQKKITSGDVLVNGIPVTKPGSIFEINTNIELLDATPRFVSKGGFKLEAALNHFNINVSEKVALDAGISTGGFTDCLLQRGIKKVFGIDVGSSQIHPSLKNDPRIILFENCNIRYLSQLPEQVDLATLDLSFISLTKIIHALAPHIKEGGHIIALIKPQFESERSEIRRGGFITDSKIHERIKQTVSQSFAQHGFFCIGIINAPLQENIKANQEFLGLFEKRTN